jgi:hypothetical protein
MRSTCRFACSIIVLVLAFGGCAGKVTGDASDSGPGSDTGTGGDTTPGIDAPSTSPCPTAMPSSSGSCAPNGLVCAYGTDPRPWCRSSAMCSGGHWALSGSTCPSVGGTCPTSAPASGVSCAPNELYCPYPDGTQCTCVVCPPFGPACPPGPTKWWCTSPPSDTRCPRFSPNLGTSCSPESLDCRYSGCALGAHVRCTGAIWIDVPEPCPA